MYCSQAMENIVSWRSAEAFHKGVSLLWRELYAKTTVQFLAPVA